MLRATGGDRSAALVNATSFPTDVSGRARNWGFDDAYRSNAPSTKPLKASEVMP